MQLLRLHFLNQVNVKDSRSFFKVKVRALWKTKADFQDLFGYKDRTKSIKQNQCQDNTLGREMEWPKQILTEKESSQVE